MDKRHIAIWLELDETGQALTGRITEGGGEVMRFSGWVGLIAALDALLRGAPPASGDEDATHTAKGVAP